jgi:hypothetical protein
MTNQPDKFSLHSRQRGAVSIAIVTLIMLILAAAIAGAVKISGSSVINASTNEEQVSALFLAESGLELAQATIRSAALANTYTNTTCTNLSNQSAILGRGSFTYVGAVSTPTTCSGGACTQCLITVKGAINTTSSRTIQQNMISSQQNGATGQTNTGCSTANCTPNIAMSMTVPQANSFAFVHIIYNANTNWGGADVTPSCQNTSSGSLTNCTLGWNISGNYYNNPGSIGVYSAIASAGSYSLTEQILSALPTTDSRNNYAAVGAIFSSPGGSARLVGSYAQTPTTSGVFPNKHVSVCPNPATTPRTEPQPAGDCTTTDYQHAYLDSRWTCNPSGSSNTTINWVNAANADTLMAGFGGKPYATRTSTECPGQYDSVAGKCKNNLNGMLVNGQPMFMQLSLIGQQGDYMYSQLWWSHNDAYNASTAGASNGATFTAGVGGNVRGCIGSSTTLNCAGTTPTSDRNFISGVTYTISSGSGFTLIGAARDNPGTNFTATGPGATGTGLAIESLSSPLSSSAILKGKSYIIITTGSTNFVTLFGASSSSPGTIFSAPSNGSVSSGNGTVYETAVPSCSGSGKKLQVCSVISGALRLTDTISGGSIINPTTITAFPSPSTNGGVGTYTVNSNSNQTIGATTIVAASNVLRVSAITALSNTSSGVLSNLDTIPTSVGSGRVLSFTTLSATGTTAGTGQTGDYLLDGTQQTINKGTDQTTQQSNGTNITVYNATGTSPLVGTALAVVTGTGSFLPDSVTGSISGTTMSVTVASGTNLSPGDALFGVNILPSTKIVARVSGTGGTGTYTITPSQAVASSTIVDRPAVLMVTSASSFSVSRKPDTSLSGAQICGGLCPILMGDGVHLLGEVTLSNIIDYDDWSSGFACVTGIDPSNIKTVVNVMSKQGAWTELVQ